MDLKSVVGVHHSYWQAVWKRFSRHLLGMLALTVVALFCLVGVYAPFFASSKPFFVEYEGQWYFPLFRYLLYSGFYTKRLDIFFNILIFTLPLFIAAAFLPGPKRNWIFSILVICQIGGFIYFAFGPSNDPAANVELIKKREFAVQQRIAHSQTAEDGDFLSQRGWAFELDHLSAYARLNLLLRYQQRKLQNETLWYYYQRALKENPEQLKPLVTFPSLWEFDKSHEMQQVARYEKYLKDYREEYLKAQEIVTGNIGDLSKAQEQISDYENIQSSLNYIVDKNQWLEKESSKLHYLLMPLRPFHWEDDAGGNQALNQYLPWWELTRTNRKDLVAALIFGIRISMVVGIVSVFLALIIGVPIGAYAGFYGGSLDILVSRLMEIWESMPTFFMLLLVIAMTQSKSIFLVIAVIGLFGWTSFSRFMRGEFFKQRNLPYIEAGHALGFPDRYLMFSHILPNAIPPILTLMPFAMMGAISAEAGLSFLGLGEEGSCSWGVLMDEGRSAFPGESYLLWPPAILLTVLLVAIALVGDALRDSLDPKG
jgi:peptide/nickel transport system permease protein